MRAICLALLLLSVLAGCLGRPRRTDTEFIIRPELRETMKLRSREPILKGARKNCRQYDSTRAGVMLGGAVERELYYSGFEFVKGDQEFNFEIHVQTELDSCEGGLKGTSSLWVHAGADPVVVAAVGPTWLSNISLTADALTESALRSEAFKSILEGGAVSTSSRAVTSTTTSTTP